MHGVWRFLYDDAELDPEKVADALVDLVLGEIEKLEEATRQVAVAEDLIRAMLIW
jgi:hypothetical protein